jgi:hypothetical protein
MGRVEGDLAVMPLTDLAIWVANRRLSGALTVERGSTRSVFTIQDGLLTRAASDDPRLYFGQFLIHFGLLTEDQLQRAFSTQAETNVLLGRILVMIGIVPEEQIIQTLRVKIAESMLASFLWRNGRFAFDDAVLPDGKPAIEVGVPLVDVHREGLARAETWRRFEQIFTNRGHLLEVDEQMVPPYATSQSLEGKILALARLGLSIEAITLELHAADYTIAVRLLELSDAGTVRPREPSSGVFNPNFAAASPGNRHLDLAIQALEQQHFGEALHHFHEGAASDPGDPSLGEVRAAFNAAVDQAFESQPSRDAIPMLSAQVAPSVLKSMSAKQRYLLARIDGKRTVQALIQVSPMHDLEALEILRQLEAEGIVHMLPPQPTG